MDAQPLDITIDGPAGALAGTLVGAFGARAALILPGSGPTDRNGNQVASGLLTDAYRLLAEALAAGGIPTLRADKRGLGGSGGDGNAVSLADYRADAAAWTADLRLRTGADCVWLIGHSEGGLIALSSADLPDLCGLILLATPGTALGPILLAQFEANPAYSAHTGDLARVIDQISVGLAPDLDALPPELAGIFQPATLGYLTELIVTDPTALVREVSLPVLAITGDADIQVPADAAARLRAANPDVVAVTLPGMTHTLKTSSTGDREASLQTYTDPTLPLHPDLAATILDFIADHAAR